MEMESIVLGGGCFWCLEASMQLISGIISVVPGYAGGHTTNPDFYSVASKTTGHAEVVKLDFDASVISFSEVLDIFWAIHNPTTLNQQGYDVGSEYRSIILYSTDAQLQIIQKSIDTTQALWDDQIITEVSKLQVFYEAEPEHHNYFVKHPEQGYCQVIINPKLQKLRQKFADRIKQ